MNTKEIRRGGEEEGGRRRKGGQTDGRTNGRTEGAAEELRPGIPQQALPLKSMSVAKSNWSAEFG